MHGVVVFTLLNTFLVNACCCNQPDGASDKTFASGSGGMGFKY